MERPTDFMFTVTTYVCDRAAAWVDVVSKAAGLAVGLGVVTWIAPKVLLPAALLVFYGVTLRRWRIQAQRVAETGFGARLATYGFEDAELTRAVDRLLDDSSLRIRLAAMSSRIRASSGTERAAELIARVARSGEPVRA